MIFLYVQYLQAGKCLPFRKTENCTTNVKKDIKAINIAEPDIQCYACGFKTTLILMKDHMTLNHKEGYKSYMCGPERQHKCPKCDMFLPKPIENLSSHICLTPASKLPPTNEIKQAILAALQETVEESGCKCKCSML